MIAQAPTAKHNVQVPFKTGAYFHWTPRPVNEALTHGQPYTGMMTDKEFGEFLKIQQSMQAKMPYQFRQTEVQAVLNSTSTLPVHICSFAQAITDCYRLAPAGISYVAAAIPTIPPPREPIVTNSNGCRPGWSAEAVFAAHLDSHGQNTFCSSDDIWNIFLGPYDFSDIRWE